MWDWLEHLSGGAANFIGSLTGAVVGLLALLAGAMFNAHLNRRRDDRLRRAETRSTASALRAELSSLMDTLISNASDLEKGVDGQDGRQGESQCC